MIVLDYWEAASGWPPGVSASSPHFYKGLMKEGSHTNNAGK